MSDEGSSAVGATPSPSDREAVSILLGRDPIGEFSVVVRGAGGQPMVIANEPLLLDGTPMPTRYWLVDPGIRTRIGQLEAEGGVKGAERAVDPEELADAHARYAKERDALLSPQWRGPRPSGGVGGTRQGVKCLHAHVAWWLAGGDDPVGAWAAERLGLDRAEASSRGERDVCRLSAEPEAAAARADPSISTAANRSAKGEAGQNGIRRR